MSRKSHLPQESIQNEGAPTLTPSFLKAAELFHNARLAVTSYTATERFWYRQLNEEQRQTLGSTFTDALTKHRNAVRMWMHLHSVPFQQAVIEVAEALGFLTKLDVDFLLREAGELPRSPEAAQAEAIRRGDLVIFRLDRVVYWDGNPIEGDWFKYDKSWNFLLIACEHAQRNQPIDRLAFGEKKSEGIVSKNKCRLMKQIPNFPQALHDAFEPIGSGTQRFAVPANRIHFFDTEGP